MSAPETLPPYPGFDPMDGEERGVTLSADNPCAGHEPSPIEPTRAELLSVSQAEAEARGWA